MFEESAAMRAKNVYNLFETGDEHSLEDQLGLLADITQSFAHSLNIKETLHHAMQKFMEYLDAEASSIFLLENEDRELVCRECAGPVDILGLRLPASKGIVGKAVTSKVCQMVRDVSKDRSFADSVDEETGFITRSILCAPLLINGTCIGALELINKRSGIGLFAEQDRHFATVLASAAALAIHNANMADKLVEQERMRKELELAREIQLSLLPVESDDDDFPISGLNIPALEVSGDFFDFYQRADGLIYFNLADVSGKGMNAAMLMAKASSLLHHLAKNIDEPGELLARVNDEMCETVTHGMFVTIVSGFIDRGKGIIRFSNAGHQPPLYHDRSGTFKEFPAESPPLGILPGIQFPETIIALQGCSLYIFTDGVTEALGKTKTQLEVKGLIELIRENSKVASRNRLVGIVAEIRKLNYHQHDDITLMLIDDKN
jgi:sigma-B regulation protein RsbU (phosphoserine phosphatase)